MQNTMSTIRNVAMGAVVVAGMTSVDWPNHGPRPCSKGTLSGTYAFTVGGKNFAIGVDYVIVGQFTADGRGRFVGKATDSVQGNIARVTFTGDYSVAPDCSGSATFVFDNGLSTGLDLFLADEGREVRIIDTDDGTLESGSATSLDSDRRR
jgi:hypothetical protein